MDPDDNPIGPAIKPLACELLYKNISGFHFKLAVLKLFAETPPDNLAARVEEMIDATLWLHAKLDLSREALIDIDLVTRRAKEALQ